MPDVMSLWTDARLIVGGVAALASLPGTVELTLLTVGGLLPAPARRAVPAGTAANLRLAVVIPAHNEQAGIVQCLRTLVGAGASLRDLIVVADNCTDNTADLARIFGATVLERFNADLRGKGYALDFAFTTLMKESGYDAFVIVDADTDVPPEFLRELRARFAAGANAVQCRYLVRNPEGSMRTRLMNLALMAFNAFRPRGRERWGLSVGILGNGFGLRRSVLDAVPYTASSVVEDLEYHLRLVEAGYRVEFVESTSVFGEMPVQGAGVKTQRARWEGGRIRMVREHVPALLGRVLSGRLRLLEPLLELLLLPLALHVVLAALSLVSPSPVVLAYAAVALGMIALHLCGAVWRCGGTWRDLGALGAAPFYVLWKLAMIPALLRTSRSSSAWVRTERGGEK
ncbi:MAG: glycosyltransferase family 2 protein [Bryobacteraceae bacterium]|nr:glycosyltransferase family 2 protein [Bryobacteraceae bacterium]